MPCAQDRLADLNAVEAYVADEGTPQLPGAAPMAFRPPEMLMAELYQDQAMHPWTRASDVWAIGCTVGMRGYLLPRYNTRLTLGSNSSTPWHRCRLPPFQQGGPWQITFSGPSNLAALLPVLGSTCGSRAAMTTRVCFRTQSLHCRALTPAPVHGLSEQAQGWDKIASHLRRHARALEDKEKSGLVHLLMQMLVTNPEERASLAALLSHPFVKGECK